MEHYIRWRAWVLVTALGAGITWTLGVIPSTFLFSGPDTGTATSAAGMSDLMIYGLAAVMGFVLGPVLGTPQWLVLRRHVQRAGWWDGGRVYGDELHRAALITFGVAALVIVILTHGRLGR